MSEVPLHPLSSEFSTIKTVDAKFWPWLDTFSKRKSFNSFELISPRSLSAGGDESIKVLRRTGSWRFGNENLDNMQPARESPSVTFGNYRG